MSDDRPAEAPPATTGRAPSSALSRSTLMAARRVLHAYRDGFVLDERLAAVAGMAADDARRRGISAEQMLIAVKREWNAMDDVRHLMPRDARELMTRLVTLAIQAYYAPAQRNAARRAGGERDAA